tara:strand:+ start:5320 stop:6249 length:930 start_codon:yes stop_codon:yes gene_type:complete
MMKSLKLIVIIALFLSSILLSQTTYNTVADIEEQWRKYTSYQKDELKSFCDFLFNEGHFERCVVASFRFLFLYPDDPLTPNVYYKIGRSYEEQGKLKLAAEYFQKVKNEVKPNTSEFRAARYRLIYINLMQGNFDTVSTMIGTTEDPYLITLDGYASFNNVDFKSGKEKFSKARKIFKSKKHRRNLTVLMRACDNAEKLPNLDPIRTGLFGIFPGGGRVYLNEYIEATGTFIAMMALGVQLFNNTPTLFAKWIPRITFISLYGGSIWGSMRGIEHANLEREIRYAKRVQERYSPKIFLDFPEPISLVIQ